MLGRPALTPATATVDAATSPETETLPALHSWQRKRKESDDELSALDSLSKTHGLGTQRKLPARELGEVEHVVDEPTNPLCPLLHSSQRLALPLGKRLHGIVEQQHRVGADLVQRRLHFMTELREERTLVL